MCGISGVYIRSEGNEKLKDAVIRMNAIQSLRGPDDEGVWSANGIALGHRRLSILDLSSAGHQPMQDASGTAHITFNGEIYNFLELKEELEANKGIIFRTESDTEVILAAYKEWGVESFKKLRGMFAFGLWDGKERALYLVRDHYGIKPLYYYLGVGRLVFASTVNALLKSGVVPPEKNPDAAIGFLLFGSVPQPLTTIKNVLALPAGHYLRVDEHGAAKLNSYYDPLSPFQKKRDIDFSSAAMETESLLKDSVSHHLISDAPLGIFLSGGLDSSALAALAAEGRENPITTLSVIFNEGEFSEQKYQEAVVRRINSDHRNILVTEKDFFDMLPAIFEAMDQPTIDGVNTFFVSWAAKKAGLKVVLSGLGSDEIFMGYGHFKKAAYLRALQSMPGFVPSALALLGGRYGKLSNLAFSGPLYLYLSYRGLRTPLEACKLLGIDERSVIESMQRIEYARNLPDAIYHLAPEDALSYLELQIYLQNQLLKDTDFMSMRHSIEVRVPFLDRPLVEYVSSLPTRVKMRNGENKSLLVEAVRKMLPKEIFERKKMGFTFPLEQWLRSSNGERLFTGDAEVSRKRNGHWSHLWSLHVARKFNLL